jgi:hypothetical protein
MVAFCKPIAIAATPITTDVSRNEGDSPPAHSSAAAKHASSTAWIAIGST